MLRHSSIGRHTLAAVLPGLLGILLLLAVPCLGADPATIIIDGKNPPKAEPIRPDSRTRVISKKGKPSAQDRPLAEDVCQRDMKGYFCDGVGKEASEFSTGAYLGRVLGVAWKAPGEAIALYLPPPAGDGAGAAPAIRNFIATRQGFYYIIDTALGPAMVETFRAALK